MRQIKEIIAKLLAKTKNGELKWTRGVVSNQYGLNVGPSRITVDEYGLTIRDEDGNELATLNKMQDEKLVKSLYSEARASAGTEAELDKLLALLTQEED